MNLASRIVLSLLVPVLVCLGTFGVLQALAKADALAPLERLQPPLLGTAMVTLFAMLMFQAVIRKRRSAGWRPSSM